MWLYKRWQPLNDIIKSTVYPPVEFIQGIPLDLEQDSFINPRTRNLVILDDLMSTASKDSRVNELFTEGSHHRNLSVMAINQNLYYNKDPTQRRNCHYLVMFNNPVDKQQVMTLARQMYPENSQHLMRYFKEATSKPYGYLLIDLKPTTPEHLRLRTDALDPIKSGSEENNTYSLENPPSGQTHQEDQSEIYHSNSKSHPEQLQILDSEYTDSKMPSCDDCGLVFENMHDLQRHVKRWCPENPALKRHNNDIEMEENQETANWIPFVQEETEEDDEDDREHEVFNVLMDKARESNEIEWNQKYDKYIKEGLNRKEAEEKTDEKMKSNDIQTFVSNYAALIQYILQLRHGSLHATIMDDVAEFQSNGYSEHKSIMMALNKNRHIIDGIWEEDDDSAMESEEYDDSETEESQSDDTDEED